MTPAAELADYLASQGVGTRGGNDQWSIHVGTEPASPQDVITIYDTGGPAPLVVEETGESLRNPTVQVRIRARNYEEAYEKHHEIFEDLAAPLEFVSGQHRYVGVNMVGEVTDIGRDSNRLVRLTANYSVMRHLAEDMP